MNRDTLSEIIGIGVHTYLRKLTDSKEAIDAWKAIDAMPDAEWDNISYVVADDVIRYLVGSKNLAEDLEKAMEKVTT